jgi:hypothetical protein
LVVSGRKDGDLHEFDVILLNFNEKSVLHRFVFPFGRSYLIYAVLSLVVLPVKFFVSICSLTGPSARIIGSLPHVFPLPPKIFTP